MTGLELEALSADMHTFVPGRLVDDNVHIMLRFKGGAKGMLWASQVAPGNENGPASASMATRAASSGSRSSRTRCGSAPSANRAS